MGRKRLLGILAGIVVLVPAVPASAIGLVAGSGELADLGHDVSVTEEAGDQDVTVGAQLSLDADGDTAVETQPEATVSTDEPSVAVSVPVRVADHAEDLADPVNGALAAAGLGPGGETDAPTADVPGGATAAGAGPVRPASPNALPFHAQAAAALDSSSGGAAPSSRPSFVASPFDTIPSPEVAVPRPEVALAAPAAFPVETPSGGLLPTLLRVLASFLVLASAFATGLVRRLHGGL